MTGSGAEDTLKLSTSHTNTSTYLAYTADQ